MSINAHPTISEHLHDRILEMFSLVPSHLKLDGNVQLDYLIKIKMKKTNKHVCSLYFLVFCTFVSYVTLKCQNHQTNVHFRQW